MFFLDPGKEFAAAAFNWQAGINAEFDWSSAWKTEWLRRAGNV